MPEISNNIINNNNNDKITEENKINNISNPNIKSFESKKESSLNISHIKYKDGYILKDAANSNPGFGLWANTVFGHEGQIADGVKVIHRTDYNYSEVADNIKDTVADFSNMTKKQVDTCRKNAGDLSKKALWSEFIKYYYEAYDIALTKAEARKVEK